MNSPRVSIGMPVYNAESFIREALDSILNQSYRDFELIISDNASTDNTEEICKAYAAKDQRIRYYRNDTNLGGAANFNRVFQLATGEYFRWASYDDICAPSYLEKCVEILDREPTVALCYSKATTIDDAGNDQGVYTENLNLRSHTPHKRFHQFLETYGWYHATQIYGLIRTDILQKTRALGNYPHADRVLLSELSLLGEFAEIPEFLFQRRVHAQTAQIANNTYESLAVWFDPKNRGKRIMPRWQRYINYYQAVKQTKLPWLEQSLCYLQIARRLAFSPGFATRLKGMLEDAAKAITPSLYPVVRFLLPHTNTTL
ncbi:MAG: glycosyltransferase [Scytolyngbya sp. HA4215-MV1]|jgi:glycosyltransferase involved in cell wall biosynthesis|nr:glycosyltransferase [Scytolyngbya sp. HA4215-MV1]